MNKMAVSKELVAVARLLSYGEGSMGVPVTDPIDVAAQYTADIGRELLRLRRAYGLLGVRQNYKGTGSQRAKRQLFVRLPTDESVDVWLNTSSYEIGGVTNLRLQGTFPYNGRAPVEVAKEIAEKLKMLAERNVVASKSMKAGNSMLNYVLKDSEVAQLENVVDPQTYDLAVEVYQKLRKDLELNDWQNEAINRLARCVQRGRSMAPDAHRNEIFKAAHALGIKLPSSMF